ncbi:MAG: hypothetical protein ABDI07_10620 [Candidatus Kryptonium sp.]
MKDFIRSNIETIKQICYQKGRTSKYTNLRGAKIIIFDKQREGENWRDWKEALEFLGELYKDYRSKLRNNYRRAIFGMPIIYSDFFEKRIKRTKRIVPYLDNEARLSTRWASPVIFKLIKSGKYYFPVVVILSVGGVDYVGEEEKERKNGRDVWLLKSSLYEIQKGVIDNFVEYLSKKDTEKLEI